MTVGNIFFFALTALVAVNFIFAEDPASELGPEDVPEGRFFFPIISTCNYTATPGSYCPSCFQAGRCLTNNVAIVRNCRGFLRYCNNGRCSFTPDATACNGTVTG